MNYKEQFVGMPEIPQKIRDEVKDSFKKYLIFTTLGKNSREYLCSYCGKRFYEGAKHLTELMKGEDYALWKAAHNSDAACPHCGVLATVKNFKKCNMNRFNEHRYIAILLPTSANEVWVRCIEIYRSYYGDIMTARTGEIEWSRYHFTPGKALFWQKWSNSDRFEAPKRAFGEPFSWSDGVYNNSYTYDFAYGNDMKLRDTFLKYCAMDKASELLYNLPPLKYLCWYTMHPQIEMLVKMRHRDILYELIGENRENKLVINWNASKPWELYGISHADYNEWQQRGADLDELKIYRRLHGKGAKDFELAKELLSGISYGRSLGNAYKFISKARKLKANVREIIKYIKKVSAESGGYCHHCPGISVKSAADMWLDYIELAEKAGCIKTISPTPPDLKKAHDALISAAKKQEAALEIKQRLKKISDIRARAQRDAIPLEKKFPKVKKVYEAISEKYAYTNDKYAIVVPSCIADIIAEGELLSTCLSRVERYYDRIERKESYIFFLRKASEPDVPYYTLEVEPSGTIRQKRTVNDNQNSDINEATEFFREWQGVLQKRLSKSDKELGEKSKELRIQGFKELRESKTIVRNGFLRGKLLADVLEADLLEVELQKDKSIKQKTKKTSRKAG